MSNPSALIVKCCVCGREKTAEGWQFRDRPGQDESNCSHGFCQICYEIEMLKIKMRVNVVEEALFY